jgi:hypothetical protein
MAAVPIMPFLDGEIPSRPFVEAGQDQDILNSLQVANTTRLPADCYIH